MSVQHVKMRCKACLNKELKVRLLPVAMQLPLLPRYQWLWENIVISLKIFSEWQQVQPNSFHYYKNSKKLLINFKKKITPFFKKTTLSHSTVFRNRRYQNWICCSKPNYFTLINLFLLMLASSECHMHVCADVFKLQL